MIATLVASSSAASTLKSISLFLPHRTIYLSILTTIPGIYPRQNAIACNVARFQIVAALAQTGNSVDKIQDQTVATAAQAGLDNASAGIGQIAKAILTGAAPPADARDQTAAGITAATQALGGGDA